LQYFNIAVVGLLLSFNLKSPGSQSVFETSGLFPILDGEYRDFSTKWYRNIGASLCFTLLVNAFSPQISKLFVTLIPLLKRCLDRGCKLNTIAHDKEGEGYVRSKKVLQSDLNALYTGPQIQTYFVYA